MPESFAGCGEPVIGELAVLSGNAVIDLLKYIKNILR